MSRWQALGACVLGAQHRRANLPCQDALHWTPPRSDLEAHPPPLIMAVADGHGSARSFRSQSGARFAVYEACKLLMEMAELSLPEITRLAADKFPQSLTRDWREQVARDLRENPFTPEEQARLGDAGDALAYGTTLLSALVTEHFIAYWQLGDGDILAVWEDGRVERPLPGDARLFANDTTSLCGDKAWKDFRCHVQPVLDKPPSLLLLCTDGYSNSFADDAGFLQAGRDFLTLLETKGTAYVKKALPDWLAQTSEAGSGDDVSLGLLWRQQTVHDNDALREEKS